ncbi:serine/threonine protein phosphatase [Roseococcus sp. SDR]|uniref:metallophosphoesterase family protein n=1 Tax=Roseococcus sp. SDR TaxID=2835532 RepID=UPI001BCF9987|nr:metallophosphoesterase family protein [Roseococcus sp. SDR]MBS7790371.1 serine/threonine protein phosphatase [Roseococcus sp. SDR]MBV1845685.1 serine/threonine protein phosphatase [Roseococcus sp. SDR]
MKWLKSPVAMPRGKRVYAIGDVHGCAEKLRELHALIRADLAENPTSGALLIHLGDFIDRGPDSAGAIELAINFDACPVVNLRGNHEATLLAALDGDAPSATDWMYYGGREALVSWGMAEHAPRESWATGIPAHHIAFLRGLTLSHRVGPYFFAHAGVRPGVPLDAQSPDDLMRIRGAFLDSEADHGAFIVHGHTPVRERVADLRENRINLDTGAVFGGVLTCGVFEEDRIGLLTA